MLDLTQLDTILKTTIDTIRQGQRQMFSIAETAREEGKHLKQELENIQAEIQETIEQVDRCELKEKASRRRLARVSADFKNFSEEDIKVPMKTPRIFKLSWPCCGPRSSASVKSGQNWNCGIGI